MGELIERMARGLARHDGNDPDWQVRSGEPIRVQGVYAYRTYGESYPLWHLYIGRAQAALACLEEPTARMLKAACAEKVLASASGAADIVRLYDEAAEQVWRAMIQSELKEP